MIGTEQSRTHLGPATQHEVIHVLRAVEWHRQAISLVDLRPHLCVAPIEIRFLAIGKDLKQ